MNKDAQAVVARINKKLGEGVILPGSEIRASAKRITSGSLSIDVALGGGFIVNQWHEVYGNESAGKTAMVLKMVAANQALDPEWTVVWVAAEEFVPAYARMLGVDLERILLIDTNIMEEAYDAVLEFLDSRSVDCVVIDSLPALVPVTEEEKSMEENQVALGARLTGKFFRKARTAMKRSLIEDDRFVTGFVINQFREAVGVMYGDNRTTPGGKAKNFWYFTRIEVRRDDWIQDGTKERVGQTIKVRVTKNKSAPAQRVGTVDYYFEPYSPFKAGDYDFAKDTFLVSLATEVITRKGAYYLYGDEKWQGREAAMQFLRDNPKVCDEVSTEVIKRLPF